MSSASKPDNRELHTWKEISGYLRVSEKTARKWARHGMPTRQMPCEGGKGRVFAYTHELDDWKQSREFPRQFGQLGEKVYAKVAAPDTDQRWRARVVTRHRSLAGIIVVLLAATTWWVITNRAGPPAKLSVTGNVLRVLDARGREAWRKEFNHPIFPPDPGSPYPRTLVADFDGDSRTEVLFIHDEVDAREIRVGDQGATVMYFGEEGRLRWEKRFGTAFTSSDGRYIPDALYWVRLLGRLSKPRADGGVIVVGGHRSGTGTFQVAIYTCAGEVVGVYTHPGWFFSMVIADLNEDGDEEIVLGGVNNTYVEQRYGATIVVLSAGQFTGRSQGMVPDGEPVWVRDWPTGKESAVILIKEFAPTPDSHEYQRVEAFTFGGGLLEALVNKGDSKFPHAWFYFDRHLKLTNIQPELNFGSKLLERAPLPLSRDQRPQYYMKELGKLRYLQNRFDPDQRRPAALTGSRAGR